MVTTRFALAPIPDHKGGSPSRSYVLFDGKPTGLAVEGTRLEAQHETYSGFLLWLTYEPPADRTLEIYLLSPAITVLDVRSVTDRTYGRSSLTNLARTGDDVFQFMFFDRWRLVVRRAPRFQIIRRAHDWGQGGTTGVHHTAYFAHRYLDLERVRYK